MLYSKPFLRAGCCALALQIVGLTLTSFPSVAAFEEEEVKTVASLQKKNPSRKTRRLLAEPELTAEKRVFSPAHQGYSFFVFEEEKIEVAPPLQKQNRPPKPRKSLAEQESTAEQMAAYRDFKELFKSDSSLGKQVDSTDFKDYIAAKAAGIIIMSKKDLYNYQKIKRDLEKNPTKEQFDNSLGFNALFAGHLSLPNPGDFEDYVAAKAENIFLLSRSDFDTYQEAKKFLEAGPTKEQFENYPEFSTFYKGSSRSPRPAYFTDYMMAKSAGITTIVSKSDLYDYRRVKNFLKATPTKEQFESYPEFHALFQGGPHLFDLPLFIDYLAAKSIGITIKSKAALDMYEKMKHFLKANPTKEQFDGYPGFYMLFSDALLSAHERDFEDYLTAKAAGITAIRHRDDLYTYERLKVFLHVNPTKEQFANYLELQKLFIHRHTQPTSIDAQDYLTAKAAGIKTIQNQKDLHDYQEAKALARKNPTIEIFKSYHIFMTLYHRHHRHPIPVDFQDYLAAEAAGTHNIKKIEDLLEYQKVKLSLGSRPTKEQIQDYFIFHKFFIHHRSQPTSFDFQDYLAAKAAGITTIQNRKDFLYYQHIKTILGEAPTKEEFEAYYLLKKESQKTDHSEPTKAEIQESAQENTSLRPEERRRFTWPNLSRLSKGSLYNSLPLK